MERVLEWGKESSTETEFNLKLKDVMESLVEKIRLFLENEARSCSMDIVCVTPEYVYRMWGGTVSLEEIAVALKEAKKLI